MYRVGLYAKTVKPGLSTVPILNHFSPRSTPLSRKRKREVHYSSHLLSHNRARSSKLLDCYSAMTLCPMETVI